MLKYAHGLSAGHILQINNFKSLVLRHIYRGQYFYRALIGFIIAFVFAAILWLNPGATSRGWRIYAWVPTIAAMIPAAYLSYGIVLRCIIRGRISFQISIVTW